MIFDVCNLDFAIKPPITSEQRKREKFCSEVEEVCAEYSSEAKTFRQDILR